MNPSKAAIESFIVFGLISILALFSFFHLLAIREHYRRLDQLEALVTAMQTNQHNLIQALLRK